MKIGTYAQALPCHIIRFVPLNSDAIEIKIIWDTIGLLILRTGSFLIAGIRTVSHSYGFECMTTQLLSHLEIVRNALSVKVWTRESTIARMTAKLASCKSANISNYQTCARYFS